MQSPVQHSDTEEEEDFLYCSTHSQPAEQQAVSSCAAIEDTAVKGPGTEHLGPEDIGDFDCPICLDLLVDPVVGSCGHDFCRHCYQLWSEQKAGTALCPVCRKLLPREVPGVCKRIARQIDAHFPEQSAKRRKEVEKDVEERSKQQPCGPSDPLELLRERISNLARAANYPWADSHFDRVVQPSMVQFQFHDPLLRETRDALSYIDGLRRIQQDFGQRREMQVSQPALPELPGRGTAGPPPQPPPPRQPAGPSQQPLRPVPGYIPSTQVPPAHQQGGPAQGYDGGSGHAIHYPQARPLHAYQPSSPPFYTASSPAHGPPSPFALAQPIVQQTPAQDLLEHMRGSLDGINDFLVQPALPPPGLASSSRELGLQRAENPFTGDVEEAISELAAREALMRQYLDSSLRAGRRGLLEDALEGDGIVRTDYGQFLRAWGDRTWTADRDSVEAGISGDQPEPQGWNPVSGLAHGRSGLPPLPPPSDMRFTMGHHEPRGRRNRRNAIFRRDPGAALRTPFLRRS